MAGGGGVSVYIIYIWTIEGQGIIVILINKIFIKNLIYFLFLQVI